MADSGTYEMLKNFILGDKQPDQYSSLREERFFLAWDIRDNFDKIRNELKAQVVAGIRNRLEGFAQIRKWEFSVDGLDERTLDCRISVWNKDWRKHKCDAIVSFGFEYANWVHAYCGISLDQGKPFYNEIREKFSSKGWQNDSQWPMWKYYNKPYLDMSDREFYRQLLDQPGLNAVIASYCTEVETLAETLETTFKVLGNPAP
ncbi:hypothetical protein V6C53_02935 [Desulfocurvibacter africanus]|uniref:hypothetical protein n=1 Tax=Desulfocurvibacter africanus TaxID=873 RepID=UPI002FD96579